MRNNTTTLKIVFTFCASLTASACSTFSSEPKPNFYQISNRVTALLEARRFDDARKITSGTGALCKGYNQNGSCYAGEVQDAEAQLSMRIDLSERCNSTIEKVATKETNVHEEAVKIVNQLHAACASDKFKASAGGVGVSQSYLARVKEIEERLLGVKPANRLSEEFEDGHPNPFAVAQNRCLDGMRWGYPHGSKAQSFLVYANNSRKGGTIAEFGPSNDPSKLRGEYKTQSECEEARLTESVEAVGEKCIERYTGDVVKIKVAKLDQMIGNPEEGVTKLPVFFSAMEFCESARVNGVENRSPSAINHAKINPVGTGVIPRFIGLCAEVAQVVCQKYSREMPDINLLK